MYSDSTMFFDDENFVILEGVVAYIAPDNNDGKAMNLILENRRRTKAGLKNFQFQVVVWEKTLKKIETIERGSPLRIKGHLQECERETEGGTIIKFMKVCADYIEFAY